MPKVGRAIGAVGTFRNFVNVLRELSIDEIRTEAETAPRLLVLAPDEAAARRLGDALTGQPGDGRVIPAALFAKLDDADRADAIVVHDPAGTGRAGELRRRSSSGGRPLVVVPFKGRGPEDEAALAKVRAAIASQVPERAPAMGRAFPAFRPAVVKALIDETARANAEFAAIANIPSVIPVIGGLASAGADIIVLTKNQLLLLFKIAAAHDRDLHDQVGILREMIPVVGAGVFWRSVAREATSFLPFMAGTVPKVAIAYVGTVVVGRAADFYYRFGRKPTKPELRAFYRQAAEAAKKLPLPKPGKPAASPANGALPAGDETAEPSQSLPAATAEAPTEPLPPVR